MLTLAHIFNETFALAPITGSGSSSYIPGYPGRDKVNKLRKTNSIKQVLGKNYIPKSKHNYSKFINKK